MTVLKQFLGRQFMNDGQVNQKEFAKLFQKGMFKLALVKMLTTFEEQKRSGVLAKDLSLSRTLDTYQRKTMLQGIHPQSATYNET